MTIGVKNAFLVNENLVKVNNSLYPITHRFVVKPSNWEFEGAILECYNCFASLRPGGGMGMNQGGGHRFEITFANTRFVGGGHQLSPAYMVWEGEWSLFASPSGNGWVWLRDVERNTGTGIGQSINPGYQDIFNQVTTLTYHGIPRFPGESIEQPILGQRATFGIYYWYLDWWPQPPFPNHDYVFWLYLNSGWGYEYNFPEWSEVPVEIHIPPWENMNIRFHVIPHSAAPNIWADVPRNDDLFLPGQQGLRVISNQWKYAPWERYPHLM